MTECNTLVYDQQIELFTSILY